MGMEEKRKIENYVDEEIVISNANGVRALVLMVLAQAASSWFLSTCSVRLANGSRGLLAGWGLAISIVAIVAISMFYVGLKIINPNEALVLVLFGKYHGTLRRAGFYWVNPFCGGINPTTTRVWQIKLSSGSMGGDSGAGEEQASSGKKLSLKAMTLKNDKQKVNDVLGNPVEIGVNVV
jgi:hypothetical protein